MEKRATVVAYILRQIPVSVIWKVNTIILRMRLPRATKKVSVIVLNNTMANFVELCRMRCKGSDY
eukprot:scaffold147156_cov40-Attheya_sp.AAC.1